MRRTHYIFHAEEKTLLGRLGLKHIQCRTGHMASIQRRFEVGLINQPAARAINNMHALFGFRQRARIDNVACFIGQRRVQGNEISARQHIVQLGFFNTDFNSTFRRQKRVKRYHTHFEALRAAGHNRSDIAAADNAQHLVGQLDPHEAAFLPLAGLR